MGAVLPVVALAPRTAQAEALDAADRAKAVQSLRDYHQLFRDRKVEIDVRFRNHFRPAEFPRPVFYECQIVAANKWMLIEEEVGPIYGIGGDKSDATTYTSKSVFDLRSERGLEVLVRDDDGSITQVTRAKRMRGHFGVMRLSGRLLAQTVGWLDFWGPWLKERDPTLDPVDVLESSPVIRRVRSADGETRLVAKLILESGRECEMRFSDLPDVRLTAQRLAWPGRSEIIGEVRYRLDADGFRQPLAFRDMRRRIDQTPPRIDVVEEALVTRFSMRPSDESEPPPVIEVPDDVRIHDDGPDDDGENQVAVPASEPAAETKP